jgi:hypothetical protein
MENSTRKYYNRVALTGAQRGEVGASKHKVLKLRFSAWDPEAGEQCSKFYTMFLNEQNNERNREVLLHLGVEQPPPVVNFEAVADLNGLGTRTVDLVEEENEEGYANIKYINEPKFGQRVYDMK